MTSHPAQSTPTKSRHAKEPWSKEGVELCKLQGGGGDSIRPQEAENWNCAHYALALMSRSSGDGCLMLRSMKAREKEAPRRI